jgi:prophage regulatory protein
MVGIGRSTLYAWVADGEFPRPVRLGARAVGWRESDVSAWLASRKPTDEAGQGWGRNRPGEAFAVRVRCHDPGNSQ